MTKPKKKSPKLSLEGMENTEEEEKESSEEDYKEFLPDEVKEEEEEDIVGKPECDEYDEDDEL